MRDLKLIKLMKEEYGITFSAKPCYYTDSKVVLQTDKSVIEDNLQQNIYENIIPSDNQPVQQINLSQTECNLNHYESIMFRTTFSMKIGETNENSLQEFNKMKLCDQYDLEPTLNEITLLEEDMIKFQNKTQLNDIEEGNYKSFYAKLLADSYQRNSIQNDSNIFINSPIENQSTYEVTNAENLVNHGDLVRQIKDLNAKLIRNQEDLNTAQNEILSLKLESARLKAENRSLRTAESIIKSNDSHPLSVTNSEDMWLLQQKVLQLNNQLEKAELTRYAYESATIQLVTFLKQITSTLTPLRSEEAQESNNISISMLTDIENTLRNNNKFNSTKENCFVKQNNLKNSLIMESISDDKVYSEKIKSKRNKSTNSFNSNSSSGNSIRKEVSRIAKKKSKIKLKKSESFSEFPLDNNGHGVHRPLSDIICDNDNYIKEENLDQNLSPMKNKGLISSLRNVFKIEGEKALDRGIKPKKKKKNFLSFNKRTKSFPLSERIDDSPLSVQSSTFYVDYCNNDEESHSITDYPPDSLPTCIEMDTSECFDLPDIDRPASELLSGPKELSVTLSMMDLSLTDITLPSGYSQPKSMPLPWEPLYDGFSGVRSHCMQSLWRKSRSSFREANTRLCFV